MAIKARDQLKWSGAVSELELEADTGEAFLVKDIFVDGLADTYTTVSIDKTTVGYFRTDAGNLGNHLHWRLEDSEKKTLLGYLMDKGIFKGFPVAEGQSITVNVGSNTVIGIVYDIYDVADITSDMENGSEAKEYMLINYGRKASTGNLANGDNEYVYTKLPSEFPDFPFGKDVPAKTTIDIYGILATDVGRVSSSGSNKQKTKYIKLIKEREVLFDEDKRGLLLQGHLGTSDNYYVGEGFSVVGNYTDIDKRLPLLFSEPLSFSSGEELSVVVNTSVDLGSANIPVAFGEVAFIEKVKRT